MAIARSRTTPGLDGSVRAGGNPNERSPGDRIRRGDLDDAHAWRRPKPRL